MLEFPDLDTRSMIIVFIVGLLAAIGLAEIALAVVATLK